jgi:hypothetical protein
MHLRAFIDLGTALFDGPRAKKGVSDMIDFGISRCMHERRLLMK